MLTMFFDLDAIIRAKFHTIKRKRAKLTVLLDNMYNSHNVEESFKYSKK